MTLRSMARPAANSGVASSADAARATYPASAAGDPAGRRGGQGRPLGTAVWPASPGVAQRQREREVASPGRACHYATCQLQYT
jgi:hypothetical protein